MKNDGSKKDDSAPPVEDVGLRRSPVEWANELRADLIESSPPPEVGGVAVARFMDMVERIVKVEMLEKSPRRWKVILGNGHAITLPHGRWDFFPPPEKLEREVILESVTEWAARTGKTRLLAALISDNLAEQQPIIGQPVAGERLHTGDPVYIDERDGKAYKATGDNHEH